MKKIISIATEQNFLSCRPKNKKSLHSLGKIKNEKQQAKLDAQHNYQMLALEAT